MRCFSPQFAAAAMAMTLLGVIELISGRLKHSCFVHRRSLPSFVGPSSDLNHDHLPFPAESSSGQLMPINFELMQELLAILPF